MERCTLITEDFTEIRENEFACESAADEIDCDDVAERIRMVMLNYVAVLPKQIIVNGILYLCHNGLYMRPSMIERELEEYQNHVQERNNIRAVAG